MSATVIGLNDDQMSKVVKALNSYLADLGVLNIKLHNLHWNVEGPNFFSLHAKLEEFYDLASEDLDEVAERILTLGHRPLASLKSYVETSQIEELPSEAVKGTAVVDMVEKDFLVMLKQSREILALAEIAGDQGTVDLMAGFISRYEKTLWMLRAYKA